MMTCTTIYDMTFYFQLMKHNNIQNIVGDNALLHMIHNDLRYTTTHDTQQLTIHNNLHYKNNRP